MNSPSLEVVCLQFRWSQIKYLNSKLNNIHRYPPDSGREHPKWKGLSPSLSFHVKEIHLESSRYLQLKFLLGCGAPMD